MWCGCPHNFLKDPHLQNGFNQCRNVLILMGLAFLTEKKALTHFSLWLKEKGFLCWDNLETIGRPCSVVFHICEE